MGIVMIVALVMSVGIVAIVMETIKEIHKRSLAHRERMKELEVEEMRLRAALPPPGYSDPALPRPSDTLIRRGSVER